MGTKYVIGKIRILERDGLNKPRFDHVEDLRFVVYDSVKMAKAYFMFYHYCDNQSYYDLNNPKSVEHLVKQFNTMSRNLGYYKILRKVI